MSTETSSCQDPSADERHRMVAVAAYFLSERRGFAPGQAEHDWKIAEEQIDRMLEKLREQGESPATLREIDIRNALRLWLE